MKDIVHQIIGINLGDLAKEIFEGMGIKGSLPQPEEEKNENISELERPSRRTPSLDDPECLDDQDREQIISEEGVVESNGFIQQVDGRKLSPNEIRLQEYLEKAFDEENWLKAARLGCPVNEAKSA